MTADQAYAPTARTVPTRYRERARYDRATVHGILDEALFCHVGVVGDAGPGGVADDPRATGRDALPARIDRQRPDARRRRRSRRPARVCDGDPGRRSGPGALVRCTIRWSSARSSSVGNARLVRDDDEKRRALAAVARPRRDRSIDRQQASQRPRTRGDRRDRARPGGGLRQGAHGRAGRRPDDLTLPHWAGILPLTLQPGPPIPADDLDPAMPLPSYLADYRRG